jgi:RND family efflux transporter MFP subunit
MSDRLLIASASVPFLCGVAALVLLQRVPGAPLARAASNAPSPAPVELATARANNWVGVVVAGSTAELAADSAGRVQSVFVKTGQRVKAGDRLLQFDRSESVNSVGMASAQAGQRAGELARSQARAQAAANQLKRLRASETWLSKQELDNAVAELRMADADVQAARASLGVSRIQVTQQRLRATRQTLTAPITGTVVALDVDTGDSVNAGQVVMRILSDDRQVRFAFPPGELPSGTSRVSIQLPDGSSVLSSVSAIRPELDPSAQLVFAIAPLPAALPDAARWIPGAAVAVSLASSLK